MSNTTPAIGLVLEHSINGRPGRVLRIGPPFAFAKISGRREPTAGEGH